MTKNEFAEKVKQAKKLILAEIKALDEEVASIIPKYNEAVLNDEPEQGEYEEKLDVLENRIDFLQDVLRNTDPLFMYQVVTRAFPDIFGG